MKTFIGKFGLTITLVTLFLLTGQLLVQGEDYSRIIEREFDVNKDATLKIKNKFGDVHCEVWDKLEVAIKVEIVVDASSKDKADKVFDRIEIEIEGDRNQVEAATTLGKGSFNNVEFSIDYYIMMPRSLNVKLKNSFGEIYIEEVDGSTDIELEYGEMDAVAFNSADNDITLKFSAASFDYLKEGLIHVEYGELDVEGSNKLNLRSRFSEVNVDKCESLLLDSQYDDISLDELDYLDVVARFSDVSVDDLDGDFKADIEYGEMDIDYISTNFTKGKLSAAFAGVNLGIDPGVSFQVEANMKFCALHYPSRSSVKHKEENYVNNIYKGVIGPDEGTSATLVIDSQNGDVDISY